MSYELQMTLAIIALFIIGTPLFCYGILLRVVPIKFLQRIACKWGWHSHRYDNWHKADNDPNKFLDFAECQWCDFKGQVDSQGNLF